MCSSGRDVMFKFLIKLKPKRARAHLQRLMLSYIIFQSLIFKMPKQLDLINSNCWSFLCFYILAVKSYILRCILLKPLSLGTSPSLIHKQMGLFSPLLRSLDTRCINTWSGLFLSSPAARSTIQLSC